MEQAAAGSAVQGALSKSDDRVLILVGHDTNLAEHQWSDGPLLAN